MAIPVGRDTGHVVKVASTTLGVSLLVLAALTARTAPRARAIGTPRPGQAEISADCAVDAPATLVEPGGMWCRAAVSAVRIQTDTRSYVADLTSREAALSVTAIEEFRRLTDDVASTTQMNVRVAVRSSAGARLVTCSRDLLHTAAACSAP